MGQKSKVPTYSVHVQGQNKQEHRGAKLRMKTKHGHGRIQNKRTTETTTTEQ